MSCVQQLHLQCKSFSTTKYFMTNLHPSRPIHCCLFMIIMFQACGEEEAQSNEGQLGSSGLGQAEGTGGGRGGGKDDWRETKRIT